MCGHVRSHGHTCTVSSGPAVDSLTNIHFAEDQLTFDGCRPCPPLVFLWFPLLPASFCLQFLALWFSGILAPGSLDEATALITLLGKQRTSLPRERAGT